MWTQCQADLCRLLTGNKESSDMAPSTPCNFNSEWQYGSSCSAKQVFISAMVKSFTLCRRLRLPEIHFACKAKCHHSTARPPIWAFVCRTLIKVLICCHLCIAVPHLSSTRWKAGLYLRVGSKWVLELLAGCSKWVLGLGVSCSKWSVELGRPWRWRKG